jgi:nicotinamidase-related amidase
VHTGNNAIRIKPRSSVAPEPSDIIIVEHWGQSGFANTDLDFRLKQRKIFKVIVNGLIANTCIESTSRFAMEFAYLSRDVSQRCYRDLNREMMHTAQDLKGPSFAHKILKTAELLAALPRE